MGCENSHVSGSTTDKGKLKQAYITLTTTL